MKLILDDLTCATSEEKQNWLQMARYAPKEKASVVDVFCMDGLPEWCREQAAEGRCVRSSRSRSSKPSSEYLREQAGAI